MTDAQRPTDAKGATAADDDADQPRWTVVGIGASAGGLAALRRFFERMPDEPGLPFVVVMHLSPEHESHLAEVLQPHCSMPVTQITETTALEPNHVYVIPPNANLESIDTHLRLSELEASARRRTPIDHFFRTMTETHDGNSIGVVLSGTGSDGTLGLRRIKEAGGLTIVQDPEEAEHDGMPRSAIADGMTDLVLPVAEMPGHILGFATAKPRVVIPTDSREADDEDDRVLQKIFAQVRARTGHDFTRYKRPTMLRRIQRRMQLHQIETLSDYLDLLRRSREEVKHLFDDLLITVTEFFRDEHVFEYLQNQIVPQLFKGKTDPDRLRIWSVGCSTGEEAYSLAILLLEEAGRREDPPQLQVFASDLHEASLSRAREGLYPESIASDVSPERLERFFVKENGSYRVRQELREMIVFAPHNLLKDPPFSHLDLIVCRNLLIYLQRDLQEDVATLFHYALEPNGLLVLGTSETTAPSDLFICEDSTYGVHRRRGVPAREPPLPVFPFTPPNRHEAEAEGNHAPRPAPAGYGELHAKMVEQYAPPSLLLSHDHDIVHYSAHAGRYLRIPGGEPTHNVFKLIIEPLRIELRAGLHLAAEQNRVVRCRPVTLTVDGEQRQIVLRVRAASDGEMSGFYLVIFDEYPVEEAEAASGSAEHAGNAAELEAELQLTQNRLQTVIEEYETSQEEMQASNEELQSTNEELRSTLEELETSKEELQSMNEELSTLNQENRHRVEELSEMTSNLENLLAATQIATLFLDREIRITWFTPQVGELFNIRNTDKGRPLSDLTHRLVDTPLEQDARRVLDTVQPLEREAVSEAGRWYLARILPYRGGKGDVEGVVITLIDITDRKQAEQTVEINRQLLQTVIDSTPDPISVMRGGDLRIMMANDAYKTISPGRSIVGRTLEEVWSELDYDFASICRRVLETGETHHAEDERFELRRSPEGPLEEAWFTWWLIPVDLPGEQDKGLLNTAHEVTERVKAEQALREAHDQLEDRIAERTAELEQQKSRLQHLSRELAAAENRERKRLAALLHDDLQQYLVALKMHLQQAGQRHDTQNVGEAMDKGIDLADQAIRASRNLTHELRPPVLYEDGLVPALKWLVGHMAEQHGVEVAVEVDPAPPPLNEDVRALLFESVRELLFNVVKHSGESSAAVVVREVDDQVRITVSDSGDGFDVAAAERNTDNSGLGLFSIRERIEAVGGATDICSMPGDGTQITLQLPLAVARGDGPTHLPSLLRKPTRYQPRPPTENADDSTPGVLVIDDHAIVRQGLVNLIAADDRVRVVGEAADGVEALHAIEQLQPDVVLMDINMPNLNGIEVTREICERWPDVKVIGLSVQDDPVTRQSMLEAGATMFVSKNDDAETMVQAVLKVI